ncbi:PREDICTED: E3 ubiquitin-protein ligase RNF103 isoform X3 [Propithecus coquereli]|uniref:E3 ubiquitin-protein ligase RNF103 isoform X3 n=1 Tax=Propithecus coquereli TaxID=379532 RepID=UPI00063EF07B|nr:PREDICTED: E3 ubiquitin-protein ligase RNF103 isoform X3 [Propithecus coquereli]
MWLKLFFLLLYFLVLFVLARFFEAVVWYETGIFATQLVDPVALSFKKLKTILECRGLGYSGLPEKKDVRELVEKSGDLMEGELYSALKEEEASESVSSTNFSGEMHFYELVEDTKDGIWLVQVIANDRSPLVGKIHWEKMVKKVSRFGIRTGTFNCSSDPRYCRRRGWVRSTLIMSVPQTSTSKGKVMLKEYSGRKVEVEHIFKWITAHAASRIKTIYNAEHLKEEWNKSDQYWNFPVESDWDEDPDLFLERLAFPDLWLHPLIPTDYIKNLPMWRFKCLGVQSEEEMSEGSQDIENDSDSENTDTFSSEKEAFEDKQSILHNSPGKASLCDDEACSCANKYCQTSPYERKGRSYGSYNTNEDMEPDWLTWPADMLHCTECVVCLENFENGCLLMGLPCGHVFHQNCIVMWLAGGRHCCPVCRWPSYKKKQPYAQHQPLSNDVPS